MRKDIEKAFNMRGKKYPGVYKDNKGRLFVKFSFDGKIYFFRNDNGKKFNSYQEAFDFVSLYKYRLGHCDNNEEEAKSDNFIHKAFEKNLEDNFKVTTAYSYINKVRLIYKLIDSYKKLDNSNIILLSDKINKQKKNPSVYIYLANKYLDFCYLNGFKKKLSENKLVVSKKALKSEKKDISYWTYPEFKKFIKKVDDDFYVLLFSFLYYLGLRIGELLALTWSDISIDTIRIRLASSNKTFSKGRILVATKSQASVRDYPMLKVLKELLDLRERKGIFVFSLDGEHVVGETTVRRALIKYIRRAHVKKISLHGFRHSCASYLINNGADYMQVASWLGHSSPAITLSVYSHLFPSRKKEIAQMFDNIKT